MDNAHFQAAPAFALTADLRASPAVTVSRLEAWLSLAALAVAAFALLGCAGGAVWFAATGL